MNDRNSQDTNAGSDWASDLVDSLEGVIDIVRSKTTEPIRQIARYLVFGLTIAGLALAVFLLFTIGLVRMLDRYLPTGVWLPYLILGGIFWAAGAFFWSRRHPKPA